MIQLSYSMLSSQVSPTLCTFAITSILIPSILVQGQLDVGSTSIGKQIIENLRLNSSLEQLLEETYETSSALQIKAKLLKQMKDDLILDIVKSFKTHLVILNLKLMNFLRL